MPQGLSVLLGMLAVWLVGFCGPAQAGLVFCNDTGAPHRLAISYKQDGRWVSEGWWQVVPGACVSPIEVPLEHRIYYFRAEAEGQMFLHHRVSFCTREEFFTIGGNRNCETRGYQKTYFAKIRLGQGTPHRSLDLSAHSKPITASLPDKSEQMSGIWGVPFRGDVIFHGCSPLRNVEEQKCSFVGGGRKFTVRDDGRTPKVLFSSLRQLPVGTPVLVQGDWAGRFDNSVDLVLRHVEQRPASREDQILRRIQGNWYSVTDPKDQFTVRGGGRQNRYDEVLTSMEYLSVMPFCGEYQEEGPYLYTWDSQGGTGLCYVVREVSDIELVLTYLPRGTELRYRRLK